MFHVWKRWPCKFTRSFAHSSFLLWILRLCVSKTIWYLGHASNAGRKKVLAFTTCAGILTEVLWVVGHKRETKRRARWDPSSKVNMILSFWNGKVWTSCWDNWSSCVRPMTLRDAPEAIKAPSNVDNRSWSILSEAATWISGICFSDDSRGRPRVRYMPIARIARIARNSNFLISSKFLERWRSVFWTCGSSGWELLFDKHPQLRRLRMWGIGDSQWRVVVRYFRRRWIEKWRE